MARESKFTIDELYHLTRNLLIRHGYDSFHFGLLAEQLDITRSALYKYYNNKDELITEFMVFEMERFLQELKKIEQYGHFEEQLEYLLEVIFKYSKIHQILSMVYQIRKSNHPKVIEMIERLEKQHDEMYSYLSDFIHLGRKEERLKSEFPDSLILGFIFQTVDIPNHSKLPKEQWKNLIMKFLCHGMFKE